MSIEVTARHVDVGEGLKEYAKAKAEEICLEFPDIEYVHIILDGQKHIRKAEVVLQGKNHIRVEADEKSENMRVALDSAIEKTERQLRKEYDKIQDHRVQKQ